MQNNLKSVTFFFEKFFKVFFLHTFWLCFAAFLPANRKSHSSLPGLTCGRYCRPETPVLFLSYLSAYFFAVMCLFTSAAFLPAGTVLQSMLAFTRRLFFLLLFLPPCILCLRHFFASKYNMLNISKKRIFFAGKYVTKNGTAI